MDLLLLFLAPIGGLWIGMLITSRVVSWLQSIELVMNNAKGGHRGAPTHRSWSSSLVLVGILHSGPWLLGGAIYSAYRVLSGSFVPEWIWFFGGMGLAPFIVVPLAILYARRAEKAKAEKKGSANAA